MHVQVKHGLVFLRRRFARQLMNIIVIVVKIGVSSYNVSSVLSCTENHHRRLSCLSTLLCCTSLLLTLYPSAVSAPAILRLISFSILPLNLLCSTLACPHPLTPFSLSMAPFPYAFLLYYATCHHGITAILHSAANPSNYSPP